MIYLVHIYYIHIIDKKGDIMKKIKLLSVCALTAMLLSACGAPATTPAASETKQTSTAEKASTEKVEKADVEEAEEVPAEVTVNKAEFDEIKNGMSYKQIVKIIGGEGEVLSESGSEGEEYHTVMYMYNGDGSIGANANFMFQSGKLLSKSQMGLK